MPNTSTGARFRALLPGEALFCVLLLKGFSINKSRKFLGLVCHRHDVREFIETAFESIGIGDLRDEADVCNRWRIADTEGALYFPVRKDFF